MKKFLFAFSVILSISTAHAGDPIPDGAMFCATEIISDNWGNTDAEVGEGGTQEYGMFYQRTVFKGEVRIARYNPLEKNYFWIKVPVRMQLTRVGPFARYRGVLTAFGKCIRYFDLHIKSGATIGSLFETYKGVTEAFGFIFGVGVKMAANPYGNLIVAGENPILSFGAERSYTTFKFKPASEVKIDKWDEKTRLDHFFSPYGWSQEGVIVESFDTIKNWKLN